MGRDVRREVHGLREPLVAQRARERPFARVDAHVRFHIPRFGEALAADLARVGFVAGVDFLVVRQSRVPIEAFLADVALVIERLVRVDLVLVLD